MDFLLKDIIENKSGEKRIEALNEFKKIFMFNLFYLLMNEVNLDFNNKALIELLEKTRVDYFQNKPTPEFNNAFPIFNVIFSGFVKKRIQKFTDNLFKNLYAIDSALLKSPYSEHVKSVMVGIHRNLKANIAHNDVLLFLGISSNEYNYSIILKDYNSMCNKFENDVLYLIYHFTNQRESLVNLSHNMEMDEPLRLRRTNAGVLLYGEFNYRFKCSFLYGIYD